MIIMRPSPIPLLFAVAVKSLKIPQNPMGLDVAATPCDGDKYQPCGWRLWGRYKLYNYGWEYCPTFNESSTGATVVSMPRVNRDYNQEWELSYYKDGEQKRVMITNTRSGGVLTAVGRNKPVQVLAIPPYDERGHWDVDTDTFDAIEGKPVV
ncbi:MAG: hypothetical protein L6R36_007416 [Xanthoria steineri]|nr:MAG: hypothetical protein L6R36_007416 [Xanthoria steineri]